MFYFISIHILSVQPIIDVQAILWEHVVGKPQNIDF